MSAAPSRPARRRRQVAIVTFSIIRSRLADQTRECLSRIDALLEKASSSREHILQAIVWLADINDFARMNSVWDAWVPQGHAPARACGETKLARPDLKVEIIITAAVKDA